MAATETIYLRVPPSLAERIRQEAAASGKSLNQLLNEILVKRYEGPRQG
ncbi:MAG: toxin-antitoxin system HicB family antitoxin [Bacillota bacterium]|nr:MAG: toxin-antitoxin system HicB family antitoxin [Bacillota bacterium]